MRLFAAIFAFVSLATAIFFVPILSAGPISVPSLEIPENPDAPQEAILRTVRPATPGEDGTADSPFAHVCKGFTVGDLEVQGYIMRCSATSCAGDRCLALWNAQCLQSGCPTNCVNADSCKLKTSRKLGGADRASASPQLVAPTPTPRPATSSGAAEPAAAQATGNAQSDIASCQQLKADAEKCCNNPASCIGETSEIPKPDPSDKAGVKAYCEQLREQSDSGGNANVKAGTACRQRHTSCTSSCSSMASSHSGNTASTLTGLASACSKLQAKVSTLASQGVSSYEDGGASEICRNDAIATQSNGNAQNPNAGSSSSSGGMGGIPDLSQLANQQDTQSYNDSQLGECDRDPTSLACQQCTVNPYGPGCQTQTTTNTGVQGTSGFASVEREKRGGYDLPDNGAYDGGSSSSGYAATGAVNAAQPATVGTVANNTGGGIPGQGGSGQAKLDGARSRAGGAPAPGVQVEFEAGLRSGGFSGYGGSGSGLGEGDYPQAKGRDGRKLAAGAKRMPASGTGLGGVDLRKYLPGGPLDPHRRVRGEGRRHPEIHGPHVNIFTRSVCRNLEHWQMALLPGCK